MEISDDLRVVLSKLYEKKAIAPPPCVFFRDILEEADIDPDRQKEFAVRLWERELVEYMELEDDILIGLRAKGVEMVL